MRYSILWAVFQEVKEVVYVFLYQWFNSLDKYFILSNILAANQSHAIVDHTHTATVIVGILCSGSGRIYSTAGQSLLPNSRSGF